MPIAGKSDVSIDKNTIGTTGYVTITTGDATHTSIEIQDVYDAIREWEQELANLDVESLATGSGKEGIGGGRKKPPTIVIQAIAEIAATTRGTVEIFRFDGGTLLSDEEAADDPDPRSPLRPVSNVEYDRTKGQEGALISTGVSGLTAAEAADLLLIRQWLTNSQDLEEGSVGNFKLWDDNADPDVDPPIHVEDVTDKDGNAIVIPEGAPARRRKQ